ncbi:hypothetical protein HG535_0E00670 [Zygotorulaspora mrakii]|uniref:GPI transamidase component GPI16 n=1 Tax=Zygotorulaspora mrakii TaxID=42260 RepID=A0A7H9B3B7_ZYGMR|nr:uncharacterized protein HG535_0E00670 [Zygotorulaspora mrakii]QLG72983.1 hypothetical protein HG535_0E00670 [Zygotorulaspora mrakii]
MVGNLGIIQVTTWLLLVLLFPAIHANREIGNRDEVVDCSDFYSETRPTTNGSGLLRGNLTSSADVKQIGSDKNRIPSSNEDLVERSITSAAGTRYPYEENLTIRPLPNSHLLTSFSFHMKSQKFVPRQSSNDYNDYSHYTVFPKAFKPMLDRTSTRQLSLRFTRGYWDSESWGRLPHDGFRSGGSGVELWATIESRSKDDAFKQWKTLANSLSGIFCASINFIDNSRTTFPVNSFQPNDLESDGLPIFDHSKQLYLIRAALANEPICTENLTPFIKLLPTKGKSGISTLLDGHRVFDSLWHSLSIDINTRCNNSTDTCHYYAEVLIDTVINVPSVLARNERPIPKPVPSEQLRCDLSKPFDAFRCFPLPEQTEVQYSISQIFGKHIVGSNLISDEPSRVCVEVTDRWNAFVDVNGVFYATSDNCFDLRHSINQDIHLEATDSRSVAHLEEAPVYVSRSLTGYGQDRGGLRTVFNNPSLEPITLVYFESLPWFMRVYLSTMKLDIDDSGDQELTLQQVIKSMHYTPASDRSRPTHLEYTVIVPPKTSFSISYQFDKSLLLYAEYPPDANHGFEVESAVVTVLSPTKYQTRTATLLLLLSTPDFSMPYNVIILTSTIMGLIFGTMFNLVLKRLVTVKEADILQSRNKSKLKVFKERILTKLIDLRG